MSTLTCQSTVIKDKDQVCLLNAGGTLGYQKCSYFPVKSVERLTQLVKDVGTMLEGKEAVKEGLIDEVGGIKEALAKLYEMIEKEC